MLVRCSGRLPWLINGLFSLRMSRSPYRQTYPDLCQSTVRVRARPCASVPT